MKIDWKRKLTSRKFWAAIVGFATAVMTAVGCSDNTVVMATSVITAGAVLIAYIVGEGLVDAAGASVGTAYPEDTPELKETGTSPIGFISGGDEYGEDE